MELENNLFRRKKEDSNRLNMHNVNGNGGPEGGSTRRSSLSDISEFELWARQLIPFLEENLVIFTAVSEGKVRKLQLLSVVNVLKDVQLFEATESVNYMPHPSFIGARLDNRKNAELFKELITEIDGKVIRYVSKNDFMNTCFITVANLPAELILELLAPQLLQWGNVIKIIPQLIPKANGKYLQVGSTRFEFKMKENVTINDIPYFVKIYSFKVYLYIRERPKICFRCSSREHLVSDCGTRFCGICKGLRAVGHSCVLSYATVTSSPSVSATIPLMHDELLVDLSETVMGAVQEPVASAYEHVAGLQSIPTVVVADSGTLAVADDVLDSCPVDRNPSIQGSNGRERVIRTRQVSKREALADKKRSLSDVVSAVTAAAVVTNVKSAKKQKKDKTKGLVDALDLSVEDSGQVALDADFAGDGQERPMDCLTAEDVEGATGLGEEISQTALRDSLLQDGVCSHDYGIEDKENFETKEVTKNDVDSESGKV